MQAFGLSRPLSNVPIILKMTMITIQINTENAAFEDDPVGELVRLFDYIASHTQERNCLPKRLFDINGNFCGTIKEDELC